MPPQFAPLLRRALDKAGLLPVDFARKAGCTHGYVYGIMSGTFKPSPDEAKLEAWADLLGMGKRETEEFIVAALVDRASPRLQRAIVRWKRRGLGAHHHSPPGHG